MSRTDDQDGARTRSRSIPSIVAKPISRAMIQGAASTSGTKAAESVTVFMAKALLR